MAGLIAVDASVLDLVAQHLVRGDPVPPEHEWPVEDLRFMLERFAGQLAFLVAEGLSEPYRAALAWLEKDYAIASTAARGPEGEAAALAPRLTALGVPAAQASLLAAAAAQGVRLFLQAGAPDEGYRDRVLQVTDTYIVDPMNCLSHLHTRLMRRSTL